MPASSIPLRRPDVWRELKTFGPWMRVYGIVLVAFGVGLAVLTVLRERSEFGPLFAVMVGGGFVAGGLVLIGMTFPPRPEAPTLVNAVAVTPGGERLADDWVHVFRRRRFSRFVTLGFAGLALYLLTLVGGILFLIVVGAEDAGLLVLLVLPLVAGVWWAAFGIRQAISRRRLGTFGRPPTGLTLGRSGLTLLDPGATRFIPWERLQSVDAGLTRTRGGPSPLYPIIVLRLRADDGQAAEQVTLHLIQYVAPAHVVFSALVTAVEQWDFREQLGTASAQSTLDAWMAATP
jgi:hypothetical protein